jgi:hypothetical protein
VLDCLAENALPCHLYEMARSLPVGIIQGGRSNTLFRFLHRLVRQLCVSHKTFLINALNFLAVIFFASILSMIIEGWLGADNNGISADYAEAMVAGEPALKVALAHSRAVLLLATDALHKETRQVALELDGEDSKSGIWRVSSRASQPAHELWLQGGLVEN